MESKKNKKKLAKKRRIIEENFKCNNTQCLIIPVFGYRVIFGYKDKPKKMYQHCPSCGTFDIYDQKLDVGIGGYSCEYCRIALIAKKKIYKCFYCRKEITKEQALRTSIIPFVVFDDNKNPLKNFFFCENHMIKDKPLSTRLNNIKLNCRRGSFENNNNLTFDKQIELCRKKLFFYLKEHWNKISGHTKLVKELNKKRNVNERRGITKKNLWRKNQRNRK